MDIERIFDETTKLINAITNLGQPNWFDYFQLFFVILGVSISAWAVWMAKRVPEKIAGNQDKIALFDKRFAAYSILQKYTIYASIIKKIQDSAPNDIYLDMFITVFFDGNRESYKVNIEVLDLINLSIPLKHMPFLFENISIEEMDKLIGALTDFLIVITGNFKMNDCKQKYIDAVDGFNSLHNEKILESLKTK